MFIGSETHLGAYMQPDVPAAEKPLIRLGSTRFNGHGPIRRVRVRASGSAVIATILLLVSGILLATAETLRIGKNISNKRERKKILDKFLFLFIISTLGKRVLNLN